MFNLNPMSRLILTDENFTMGPKRAAREVTEFARGVVHTMNLISDGSAVTYRPVNIQHELFLASTGGYIADIRRVLIDAMLLNSAATWRFDFLRPVEDQILLTDAANGQFDFNRSLEQSMVLNSLAVTTTTYLRTLSQLLSLTDLARQTVAMESVLDILLLDHQSELIHVFVVNVAQTLSLTSESSDDVRFVRAIDTILSMSQTAEVDTVFLRAVEDLLLLVDDAERFNALVNSATSTLALTPNVLDTWVFRRPDERTLSLSSTVNDGYIAVCDQLDWTQIGYDYTNDPQYGKETARFPMQLGSHSSSNVNHWIKYYQCWYTNLQTSEPPTPTYGGAGPTGFGATNKWRGAFLSTAGYVYFVPYSSTNTYKFDPSNNTGSNLTTTHTGNLKWAGGGLGFNGNAICAPYNSTTVLHINTSNDAETTFGSFTGNFKWSGVYVNKNGWAICAPRMSSQILAVNPDSTSNDVYLSTGPTTPDMAGGQLAADGVTLYVCPTTSLSVLKCNTANHQSITWSWLKGSYTGTNKWFGMAMDVTGNIYCVPYNSTNVLKIQTQNNDYESTFGTLTGNEKWVTAVLSHDSRIYTGYWNAINALVIRTADDTTFTFNTFNGGNSETCGIIAIPDSRLIVVPNDISAIPHYLPDASSAREEDFLLSPYWNKF